MKNKFFTAIFLIISLLWVSETFAQQNSFVRKKVHPEFFIPEKAYDKPEKLPEFYVLEPEPLEEVKTISKKPLKKELVPIIMPELANKEAGKFTENVIEQDIQDDEQSVSDIITITDADLTDETFYVSDYLHFIDDIDLRDLPLYKQKYDEYLADLEIISQTGKIPDNASLTKDLAMMKSNLKINADEQFGIKDVLSENPENKPTNDNNL